MIDVAPTIVPVSLGARSYDVVIGRGLVESAAGEIRNRWPSARVAIVTDETVARHHLVALQASFGARCLGVVTVPPGEQSKSFASVAHVTGALLETGLDRADLVLALGGGVIGDLAGFAASILRRGVRFVQIPTTLLAQVDSSVGGKTGINTPQGKNLAGAFHQPVLVFADTDVLSTLPARQMRAGYAEVVKYGLLGDRAFYEFLEQRAERLLAHDPNDLAHAIRTCVRMKAGIVARDETETGERMLLNLGHTFGHALEAWAGYSERLLHGEAVAIGMAQAFRFSVVQGHISAQASARVEQHLRGHGLPTRISDIPGAETPTVEALMTLMAQDKKAQRGRLTLILVREIGQAFVARDVAPEAIAAFLSGEVST